MDKDEFTAAVLAAEPTLYRVAKTMLRNEQDCADIDRTLYTLGFSSQDASDRIDTEIAVLAQPVSLENVKSVTINDVTYAMAYR